MSTNDSHTIRDLKRRLRIANKTMGRQGQTIAALRGDLARAREETSKIDRGELRRLERFAGEAVDQLAERTARNADLRAENRRLREKLAALEGPQHDNDQS